MKTTDTTDTTDSTTRTTPRNRIRHAVAGLVLVGILSGFAAAQPAGAINPPQSTVAGTVNTLYNTVNYWSYYVVASTGRSYRSPLVGYGYAAGATRFPNGCQIEAPHMAIYCGGDIYFHVPVNQDKINRLGDNAAGYWLAHEFGHHVATSLGLTPWFRSTAGRELYADCMAGVFTRYAYARGVLNGNDYNEALWTLGDTYPYEGSVGGYPFKSVRKNYFAWGYSNNNVQACADATVNLVA